MFVFQDDNGGFLGEQGTGVSDNKGDVLFWLHSRTRVKPLWTFSTIWNARPTQKAVLARVPSAMHHLRYDNNVTGLTALNSTLRP